MRRFGHKFHAVQRILDGIKFPSKREAARYERLKGLQAAGQVLFFLRQVPFHLDSDPPTKYVADFVVFWSDGTCTIEDAKGMKTDVYILKRKLVEFKYPITITEV